MRPLSQDSSNTSPSSSAVEQIQADLKRIYDKTKWAKCGGCGEDWTKLEDNGSCPECNSAGSDKKALDEFLVRALGEAAHKNCTLDRFTDNSAARKALKGIALKFRPDKDNLYIFGVCRSGKSHIAMALAIEWASALRGSVGFWKTRSLARVLMGMRGWEQENYIKDIASRRLLVIDDIGVEKSSEWVLGILYDIIEHRIANGINGLIITTNLSLDGLGDKFGDLRLSARLGELCQVVSIDEQFWPKQDRSVTEY